jgi:hypothetical protein
LIQGKSWPETKGCDLRWEGTKPWYRSLRRVIYLGRCHIGAVGRDTKLS